MNTYEYESAAQVDLLLDFVWKPRTNVHVAHTDAG